MATFTSGAGPYTLILNANEVGGSSDVGSNTSKVSWSLQMRADSAYCQWNPGPGDFEVRINGGLVWSAQNPSLWYGGMGGTLTLASGTTTVGHNSDGAKTVYCEGKYIANSTANYLPNSSTCGGNLTLSTIPRASSFSSITGNTIGGSQTINIDRKSSSFTHSLWYKIGSNGNWVGIGSNYGTSAGWTIPLSLNNQIPNSTSLTLTYILRTYNGSTQIGSDVYYNYTVYYSGAKPTAGSTSISYSNLFNNKFIANYSSAVINYNGYSGVYGSSIKSAQVIFNGSWKESNSYNTGKLTAGTYNFQGVVTDSRNYSSYSSQQSFTCYQINNPTISINAYRSDAEGNATPSGTYITIIPTYSAHDPVGGNSIKSNSFTCTSLMTTGTAIGSGSKKILSNAAVDSEYIISGTVTDQLGRSSATSIKVGTAFTILDVRPDEKGMAFGKYSTGADKFEVAWDAYFDGDIYGRKITSGNVMRYGGAIDGFSGSSLWVKLGTWDSYGDSNSCKITVLTGNGFNAEPSQNTEIEIFIKDSYQSSASTTGAFGASFIVKYNYNYSISVWVMAQSYNQCDVWVRLPYAYGNGHYLFEGNGYWTHSGDTLPFDSNPTSGVGQSCKEMTADFKGYPVGSIYLSWDNTNPQTFMGGTWVRMAEGRGLFGVGRSTGRNGIADNVGEHEEFGNWKHALSVEEMPSHDHGVYIQNTSGNPQVDAPQWTIAFPNNWKQYSSATRLLASSTSRKGGNQSFYIMPPYIGIYVWRRTA